MASFTTARASSQNLQQATSISNKVNVWLCFLMLILWLSFHRCQVPWVFHFSFEVNLYYTLRSGLLKIKISNIVCLTLKHDKNYGTVPAWLKLGRLYTGGEGPIYLNRA